MTTDAEHAARNQQMIALVLGLAAVAVAAHRKGAAASAAVRSWAAANTGAWHSAKPTD